VLRAEVTVQSETIYSLIYFHQPNFLSLIDLVVPHRLRLHQQTIATMPYKKPTHEPMAIVGASCRFAGHATSPSRLWKLLALPTDLSREVPADRFNIKVSVSLVLLWCFGPNVTAQAFYHHNGEHHGTTNSPKAYFIDQDHKVFDASFFNISPKEAEAIDPQQRMLLEVAYEALESAGYTLQQYAGEKVAVFAGQMTGDYDSLAQRDELFMNQYYATGNARSILSNRISYFFNFTGPSATIDTACSSSLVALHQAVLSLRSGESKMACVAGANLILTPEQYIVESNLHMLSPTGHCRMWDAGANGYARGEGVAAIFIKPLSQALADGDRIEAIIRETGVNSDGRTRGITMPNWEAQSRLIQETYAKSGLDPKDPEDRCQYFEAHGTGTSVGDPNEARAIKSAFFDNDSSTSERCLRSNEKLLVGSVKTVIGHTEGAAGLAGILKVVESMRHNSVPPNLHLEKLSPEVQKHCTNLLVPTSAVAWPEVPAGQPKRGSVNSFGFGGTNAHVIIEQYDPDIHGAVAKTFPLGNQLPRLAGPVGHSKNAQVCLPLVLSAPSPRALATVAKTYRDYLLQRPELACEEVAWHCFSRRTAFPFRVSVSSTSVSGLVKKLDSLIDKSESLSVVNIGNRTRPADEQPKILGVFTGQGAQWATMSRGLLLSSQVYANTIRRLDRILQRCPNPPAWSLEQEIMADEHKSRVQKAYISQPLCTAIQLALVQLLRHLGVRFSAVVGHSSGEIAAAYAAGRLSIRDAMLIAYYRGLGVHLARGANGEEGGMLAAGLSKAEADELCVRTEYSNELWVAAINSSRSVTLSGSVHAVEHACDYLVEDKKFARKLFVDAAYHSPHMERPAAKYLESLAACGISPRQGNGTTWVSSVYGLGGPTQTELTGRYWKDNMIKPVLFHEAVTTTLETAGPFDCAVEVGPHPALLGPVTQTLKETCGATIPYCGLLCRKVDDREAFASFLGWMWTEFGSSFEQIRQFVLGSVQPQLVNTRLVDAPTYPWDHSQRYWFESRISRQYHFKTEKPHELLGVRTRDDNKHQLRWRSILMLENIPWAKHHSFQGQALLPASAYLIMTLDAAQVALAGRQASVVELRDLKFPCGIILEREGPVVEILFNLAIDRDAQDTIDASFTLTSVILDGSTDMKMNFSGNLSIILETPDAGSLPPRPERRAETLHASPEAFYNMMAGTGLAYTGPFKGLRTLERRCNFASGTLSKYHVEDTTGLRISPATLDSCLQTAFVTVSSPGDNAIWTSFLPLEIECVRFNLATCDIKDGESGSLAVDAYLTKETPITGRNAAAFTADVEIFNHEGCQEIQVQGLTVRSFCCTKPDEDYELYLTTKFDIDPDDEIVSVENSGVSVPDLVLVESCERVASFYTSPLSVGGLPSARSSLSPTSWPRETEETLDNFVRTSEYFLGLDFILQVGKAVPKLLANVVPAVIEETSRLVHFQRHVSRIVRQIAHKYPHMNVLGLTDTKLGMSEHILGGLQNSFQLYRVGSEPEMNLESRVQFTESLRKKVMVDKVDLEAPQGEHERLYDLVILAASILESHKVIGALTAIKRMMRPGGFLVLVDSSCGSIKDRIWQTVGFAQGESDTISPPAWPDLLSQSGFLDCLKNSQQCYHRGYALIIRQAASPEKGLLLHPLTGPAASYLADHLLVVGGKQRHTSQISSGVRTALRMGCGRIQLAESLDHFDATTLASFSAVILLNDIDEPILATMTKERMDALRALFRPQMTILWVTYDARFSNPDHAASFGFARVLTAETPGLVLQMLDLDTLEPAPAVEAITEAFARLTNDALIDDMDANKPLWTKEREVHMENGRRLVPRVVPWKAGNDRVNAPRRVVTNIVNTLDSVVRFVPVESEDGSWLCEVEVEDVRGTSDMAADQPEFRVDYSTARPMSICGMMTYICIGRNLKSARTQAVLTESNSSYLKNPLMSMDIDDDDKAINQPALLARLVRYLAAFIMSHLVQRKSIILVQPDKLFCDCAKDILARRGIQLCVCSTDAVLCAEVPGAVLLHPTSPLRQIKALYPREGAWVIDMLPASSELSETLVRTLPKNCKYTTCSSPLGSELFSNNKLDSALFKCF
jgi:acyl transferase domain-containing protein